jgi:lipopolysaccharide/colanic/teichoic acid biosynthesis glycosyltransferase
VHPEVVRRRSARRVGKRSFDLVVGTLCLLVLSPLMVLLALLIRWTSPGPALFCQTRLGQHGRPFRMYKFRTMQTDCSDALHRQYVAQLLGEEESGTSDCAEVYKLTGDPRVTRIGAVLRRTSLDEVPQLFNVLRGEMSLVGPRPMLPWERELIDARYQARFSVPAGMTGLWQVSGRSRLTFKQALDLDVEYARRCSLALDLVIVTKTALALLLPRGGAQ